MLAIAQALMPGPKLLMLDEPSAGLAPVVVQEVLETVRGLKAAGLGILLVEQLVDQALSVADVIVVIEHGRTVSSTTAERGMNLAALRDAYLGRDRAPVSQDGDP
jgi:branched-chain amino acid transport system ATP-binding protein